MVIYKNIMKRMFSSKSRLFIIFALPILFGFLFTDGNNIVKVNLCVIDYDNTVLSKALYNELSEQNNMIESDEYSLKNLMINGGIDYAIIIDKGFSDKLLSGNAVQLKEEYFIESGKILPVKIFIQNYINNIKNILNSTKEQEEVYNMLEKSQNGAFIFKNNIMEEISTERTISQIGFLVQFMLYMSVITSSFLLIDRNKNTFIRIISSSISRKRYIIENLLGYITVSSLQVLITLGFMKYIMNFYFGNYFGLVLLITLTFGICTVAFGMVVVTIIKSEMGSYWAILVITTPLVMLGGCYFELSSMPDWIIQLANFIPTKWIMEGSKELIVSNDPSNIPSYIAILLTFAITFFIISIGSAKNMAKS